MLHCVICDYTYATVDGYNCHLNRYKHKNKVQKFETVYSVNKSTNRYKQWVQIRDAANKLRQKKEKTKNKIENENKTKKLND